VAGIYRVVLDTNILLRGLINMRSSAGRVVDACDRRAVLLLLSRPVLSEYRAILTDPRICARYPELTTDKVNVALRRLRYVADTFRRVESRFAYARDPKDEPFIELAIAGKATHIVTADADLLSLKSGHGEAAKRFRQQGPAIEIVDADTFIAAASL
jgi:uncharacterized protein